MNNHKSHLVGHGEAWQGKCSCGWRSSIGSRADADEAQLRHHREVDLARAGLKRQPSMEQSLAWYSRQAADTANSPEERKQWEMLASELRPFVEGQENTDTPLWE